MISGRMLVWWTSMLSSINSSREIQILEGDNCVNFCLIFFFCLQLTQTSPDLDIRTYSVVALNEECGFIQWVPNTVPIRPVIVKYYEARRIKSWVCHALPSMIPINNHDSSQVKWPNILSVSRRWQTQRPPFPLKRKFYQCESKILWLTHGVLLRTAITSYMPVFHEWFIETFPEPTAWLASRLTYGRTAAVMSMVGFILG